MIDELFHNLNQVVRQGERVALATVVSRKGSLPMSQRAKMLVFQNGSIWGTIGGGGLEANVIEEARHVLDSMIPQIMPFDLTSDQIESDGLTCGGTVEIFLEPFSSAVDMTVMQELEQMYSASSSGVVVTLLPDGKILRNERIHKMLLNDKNHLIGTSGHSGLDRRITKLACSKLDQSCFGIEQIDLSQDEAMAVGIAPQASCRLFFESIIPDPTVYLFGGGHVSQHLAYILHVIGFEFVVIDDRREFLVPERFPHAKACIFHEFTNVFEVLECRSNSSYIVIVTRGHTSDMVVLEQAIRLDVKYIGMIGSKRKVKLLFEHLKQEGISEEQLQRIHAPIGLEIGADTPEEIAISIAAELINVRRTES